MNKREFLKAAGMAGVAAILPIDKILGAKPETESSGGCVLIPSETAGPFPLDLTENSYYFRTDISESQPGVPLHVRMKIIGSDNCLPIQNVRVNIWHCTNEGVYSGYDVANNPGQAGLTYLRGYQITDAYGEVQFSTIFPGWYNGRICHIHFQVYVSSSYSVVSQMTFDPETKNAIYAANPSLYPDGEDPLTYETDNIFSDGYELQIASLEPNDNGGYDAYLEVTIQGSGTSKVGHLEKETAKNVVLGQNFPNPFDDETTIPFTLNASSDVQLHVYDLNGRLVATPVSARYSAGEHQAKISLIDLGLARTNYAYQIEVKNDNGKFITSKLMTVRK